MNNRRIRTEFFHIIGHAVIKPCPNCQDYVGVMHGHIGFIGAMHTKHTQELAIRTRKRT